MLIEKAYAAVNYLMDIFTNATFKLQSKYSDTLECVKYITFLDEMKEEVSSNLSIIFFLLVSSFIQYRA